MRSNETPAVILVHDKERDGLWLFIEGSFIAVEESGFKNHHRLSRMASRLADVMDAEVSVRSVQRTHHLAHGFRSCISEDDLAGLTFTIPAEENPTD